VHLADYGRARMGVGGISIFGKRIDLDYRRDVDSLRQSLYHETRVSTATSCV